MHYYFFHPLVLAAPTEKPVAWKVSITHFCTKLSVFICIIYEAGFEGNTSFLAKRLVNWPCHLVVTSKFECYCACPGFAIESLSNLTVRTIHPLQGEKAKNNCFAEHKVGLQNQSLSGIEPVLLCTLGE